MEEVLISESLSSASVVRETNLRTTVCLSGLSEEDAKSNRLDLESQGYTVTLTDKRIFDLRAEKLK